MRVTPDACLLPRKNERKPRKDKRPVLPSRPELPPFTLLSSLFLSRDRRVVPRYRGACVCLFCMNVLLLGQYHCEEGLGEWVEFTSDQRFL